MTTQPNKQSNAQPIIQKKSLELRFLLFFLVSYAIFHSAYFMVPDSFLRDVVFHHGIVAMSQSVIDFAAPGEHVTAVNNKLLSPKAALEVVRGCDGSGALFLILSAILAFSATVKRKFLGVVLGVALIYGLNQIRIIALYFIIAYQREWFLPIHTYFAPTLIVIISCIFFAWWAFGSRRLSHDEQPLVH